MELINLIRLTELEQKHQNETTSKSDVVELERLRDMFIDELQDVPDYKE